MDWQMLGPSHRRYHHSSPWRHWKITTPHCQTPLKPHIHRLDHMVLWSESSPLARHYRPLPYSGSYRSEPLPYKGQTLMMFGPETVCFDSVDISPFKMFVFNQSVLDAGVINLIMSRWRNSQIPLLRIANLVGSHLLFFPHLKLNYY